jgi:CIC family chloride channel protein
VRGFAPLLVVGASIGSALAAGVNTVLPAADLPVAAFALVGMSTFFAAVVRSPLTGIILCVEMTAATSVLVPMLLAAGTAMVVCTMLGSTPIYDVLRARLKSSAAADGAV